MAVGVYEAVWLFVAFDLPTLTKDDRRRASRFRNDLLDMGFSMFQLSFYAYYLKSKQQAETIAKKIRGMVPPKGTVSVFFITDAQFALIQTYVGGNRQDNKEPEQGLLFL